MTAVVLRGDARALPLPDASVDLVVTSVPYWGLRSYTDGGEPMPGQIGSEATPQEWLANLLDCVREWCRVLKPQGSMFVNCGDKYDSGTTTGRINPGTVKDGQGQGWHQATPRVSLGRPKSLLGLPWRLALACTDQLGLILRRDIIWSKPNGLPESVTDRCRSSHEYLFHLVKQPRYYAAVDEIREAHESPQDMNRARAGKAYLNRQNNGGGNAGNTGVSNPLGKLPGSVWSIPSQPLTVPDWVGVDHFAAFPCELPRRCILGWSPPGICTACGEGRRPVVAAVPIPSPVHGDGSIMGSRRSPGDVRGWDGLPRFNMRRDLTGYACACPDTTAPTRPSLIVDPFGGTGTTSLVASMLGRTGVSIDRSMDYTRLARWRTTDPAERARAMQVPKPPPVPAGQVSLFDLDGEAS